MVLKLAVILIALAFNSCATTIKSLPYPPEGDKSTSFDAKGEPFIGPGDVLLIRVLGQTDISGEYKVSPSGMIAMPLIGNISVLDKTPNDITKTITENLREFIKSPNVSITINQFLSQRVVFVGEWNRPGPYSFDAPTTLLEAIGAGGNLTRFASGRIVLIRKKPTGERVRYATTLEDVLNGKHQTDIVQLIRGDVVVAE